MVRLVNSTSAERTPVERLAAIIQDIRVAMLSTVDADGTVRARPMATQRLPFDGTLWFFTARDAHKVDEIRARPWVNVTYASPHAWVSISGQAEAVVDGLRMRQLWNPLYEAWFPRGLDDPDLLLLRIRVEQADWWSTAGGAATRLAGFVKAIATGKRVDDAEHQHLELSAPDP